MMGLEVVGGTVGALVGLSVVGERDGLVKIKAVHQRDDVGSLVGLVTIGDVEGLVVMRGVDGALVVGLMVVGEDENAVSWLVVGDSEGLTVMRGVVGLTVGDSAGLGITRGAIGLTVVDDGNVIVLLVLVMLVGPIMMVGLVVLVMPGCVAFCLPTTNPPTAITAAVATKTDPSIMTLYLWGILDQPRASLA